MTTDSLSRAFVADIEVRSSGDGRTIAGIVVPFGRTAVVSDGGAPYEEGFEQGAFAKTIREAGKRVKLLSHHNAHTNPLGVATMLREDTAGLYGEFKVSATAAGDEALELARDGAIDSFSVGFKPIKHVKRGRVTWRTEVGLREASLVTFGAYEGARVESVRMAEAAEALVAAGLDPDAILRMLAEATDLRATTPVESEPTGTPSGAAPTDEPAQPLRSVTQRRLAFKRALIERNIHHVKV